METDKSLDLLAGVEYDIQEFQQTQALGQMLLKDLDSHLIDKFEAMVARQPKKPFVIYNDIVYTYEEMDRMACRVACVAKSWGLRPRDCVTVVIDNEPSFVWIFYGLMKLGVSVAFVNHNLRSHPLTHCILSVDCKAVIVGSGPGLLDAVTNVLPQLGNVPIYAQGVDQEALPAGILSFDACMLSVIPAAICPAIRADLTLEDFCCYIFTSGTTGKPKPVIFTHAKAVGIACACTHIGQLRNDDVFYCTLPLYHNTGVSMSLNAIMRVGGTLILKNRFSASSFWSDCRKYNVTVIPYIGELLRYLLSQPKNEMDGVHNVRLIFGAGFRADIWQDMVERFKIPQVTELYGATEGFSFFVNYAGKPGAVGRLSPLLKKFDTDNKVLVKFDTATALPVRDGNGRCVQVKKGEPGLFLSQVPEHLLNKKIYKASAEANEKKLVRDVFVPGDAYMNYGDALYLDREYFLYFYDRLGDTFRWKGENVSTKEVADTISTLPFIEDANVYGVEIPGRDGKAGMAALTLLNRTNLDNKDLSALYQQVCKELPAYARPLFVRHLPEAMLTGTFKNKKVELASEGYDLAKVNDPIYYLNHEDKTYSPWRKEVLATFMKSKL